MYTKWLVITIVALGVGIHHTSAAHAQTQGEVEHKNQHKAEQNTHRIPLLNATPEQVKQIKLSKRQYADGLAAVKSDHRLSEDQIKQRTIKLRQETEASLEQFFNPEQLQMIKMHGGMGIFLGYAKATNPLDLIYKLDLTPQQAGEARKLINDLHQALDSIKQNGTLAPDQVKLRMEQIHSQMKNQLHALLTPEQMIKLHKLMGAAHDGSGGKTIPPNH